MSIHYHGRGEKLREEDMACSSVYEWRMDVFTISLARRELGVSSMKKHGVSYTRT